MSLRQEIIQSITETIDNMAWRETTEICADEILKLIQTRIDAMIKVDDETMQRDLGTKEGKIAAQASMNTLILVKELLTK